MTRQWRFQVLVVEDDPDWREALCRMYEEVLAPLSPIVESAGSGPDALRRLRTENTKFDLLSLDINLGLTHPRTREGLPDTSIRGVDGRTVLRVASEKRACKGVVVITGLQHDETLHVVIPDEQERKYVRMALGAYLQEVFPGKYLYLLKDRASTISESIQAFKQMALSYEKLLALCEAANKFYREGQNWCITFNGKTIRLKEARGLHYIAHLLHYPGHGFHSVALVAAIEKRQIDPASKPHSQMSEKQLHGLSMTIGGLGDAGEILDPQARAEYKSRLDDLRREIEEAQRSNDPARTAKAQEEFEWIVDQLAAASGLGGRNRKAASSAERARQAVSKAISRSLSTLKAEHQELWHHLNAALHIGSICAYSPSDPLHWTLDVPQ